MAKISATLSYAVNPLGTRTIAQLITMINAAAVPIPPELVSAIGGTVSSDTTVSAGGQAVRTIIWTFNAAFRANFPNTSDQSAPFKGLMTSAIEQGSLKSRVVEAAVVLNSG